MQIIKTQQDRHSDSVEQTQSLGAAFGQAFISSVISGQALATATGGISGQAPAIWVALQGELGAGKTTWVAGLLQGLGFTGAVKSPTYTLLETYALPHCVVQHLDLYRIDSGIKNADELAALGLADLVQPHTLILLEWAERAYGLLPQPDVTVAFAYDVAEQSMRRIVMKAGSLRGQQLLGCL